MNEVLTLENLITISLPRKLKYSSDSLVDESDKISQQIVTDKFNVVISNIGDELFSKLSYEDRMLMVNTAGVIDFGRLIDLGEVEKEIRNYGYSK